MAWARASQTPERGESLRGGPVPKAEEILAKGEGQVGEARVVSAHPAGAGLERVGQAEGRERACAPAPPLEVAATAQPPQPPLNGRCVVGVGAEGGEAVGRGCERALPFD